jgi:hypothetical protein
MGKPASDGMHPLQPRVDFNLTKGDAMKIFEEWPTTGPAEGTFILMFLIVCALVALIEIKHRLMQLAKELPLHWRAGKFAKVAAAVTVTVVTVAHAGYLMSELYTRAIA